jgi:hypothetical protein
MFSQMATPLASNPEEEAYLAAVRATPLVVSLPKDQADDGWGRAQSFVGKYSSMKVQVATDYVLQTFNPASPAIDFGYYITRTPLGDQVEFDVKCVAGNSFTRDSATLNAHVLAHYIQTGELNPKFIEQ